MAPKSILICHRPLKLPGSAGYTYKVLGVPRLAQQPGSAEEASLALSHTRHRQLSGAFDERVSCLRGLRSPQRSTGQHASS